MKRRRLLLVAQEDAETSELAGELEGRGCHLKAAGELREAQKMVAAERFDVIVIDDDIASRPEQHSTGGFWAGVALSGTPVIALVSPGCLSVAKGVLRDWAQDFIKKPATAGEVLVRCDLALERKQEQDRLYVQATRDALTGLFNRRYLMDFLVGQVYAALRVSGRISLILCDLDGFKAVNDTFGHLVGDGVLAAVGEILLDGTRRSDVCARYGGEEFAVACPSQTLEECVEIAERLRRQLEENEWLGLPGGLSVTGSFGVAQFDGTRMEHSVAALIAAADEALFEAKRSGKNKTVVYQGGAGLSWDGEAAQRITLQSPPLE